MFLTAVFLLYLAVKRGVSDGMRAAAGKGTGQAGSVRQILDERYALGEISQEEYERMRREVEGHRVRPAVQGLSEQRLLKTPKLW